MDEKAFFGGFLDEIDRLNKLAQVDEDKVMDFLVSKPNPDDEAFHEWAAEQDVEPSKAEAIAYRLATKYARLIKGGYSENQEPEGMDPEQLKRGIQVELEHTPDADVAKKIALDHLYENADYYTELDKMEKRMSNAKKKAAQAEMEAQQGVAPEPGGPEGAPPDAGGGGDRDDSGANFGGRPPELGPP